MNNWHLYIYFLFHLLLPSYLFVFEVIEQRDLY
jgi:hypothetical protein